jgi:hypothetical protein
MRYFQGFRIPRAVAPWGILATKAPPFAALSMRTLHPAAMRALRGRHPAPVPGRAVARPVKRAGHPASAHRAQAVTLARVAPGGVCQHRSAVPVRFQRTPLVLDSLCAAYRPRR